MSTQGSQYDFSGLSRTQIDALANVAFNGGGAGCARQTLASLERRGFIEPEVVETPTSLGVLRITEWTMPLPVHMAFCAWCSVQPDCGSVS
jgi:hypothetical protein